MARTRLSRAQMDTMSMEPERSPAGCGSISRAFDRFASGRIAVKVINHLGDEVMKVFRV